MGVQKQESTRCRISTSGVVRAATPIDFALLYSVSCCGEDHRARSQSCLFALPQGQSQPLGSGESPNHERHLSRTQLVETGQHTYCSTGNWNHRRLQCQLAKTLVGCPRGSQPEVVFQSDLGCFGCSAPDRGWLPQKIQDRRSFCA